MELIELHSSEQIKALEIVLRGIDSDALDAAIAQVVEDRGNNE